MPVSLSSPKLISLPFKSFTYTVAAWNFFLLHLFIWVYLFIANVEPALKRWDLRNKCAVRITWANIDSMLWSSWIIIYHFLILDKTEIVCKKYHTRLSDFKKLDSSWPRAYEIYQRLPLNVLDIFWNRILQLYGWLLDSHCMIPITISIC